MTRIVCAIGGLCLIFVMVGICFAEETIHSAEETYLRGQAIAVEDRETASAGIVEQEVKVKLAQGPQKGEVINILNSYLADHPLAIHVEEGMNLIIVAMSDEAGLEYYIQDVERDRGIYYLLALGLILIVLIGRIKGVKTVISLIVTGVLIFYGLLPQLLAGRNPIFLSVLVAGVVIVVSLLLVSGFNLKTLAAIIGTFTGVMCAGVLTLWVGNIAYLTGFGSSEAQMLRFLDFDLDMRGILFAGIIIGSLGAITDVGISVASAAAEIKEANPGITVKALTEGALNVGRDVMGTMANTLILAYVGTATPLLLLVMAHGIDWLRIINMDLIATELVRGLVGVIGLISAVPVTALVSGLLLSNRKAP